MALLGPHGRLVARFWAEKDAQSRNLAIVEREARSQRELQARQERQEQRGQQEQGEPERQHHEKQHRKSGKTSESLQTAIQYNRLCPCSPAARPRRAVGAGSVSRAFLRSLSSGFPARARSQTERTTAESTKNTAARMQPEEVRKCIENGSKIPPRRFQHRCKMALGGLPPPHEQN